MVLAQNHLSLILKSMKTISITQLKANPSKAIDLSLDFPLAVQSRNKTEAYLMGKKLYEALMAYIEDKIDAEAIINSDLSKTHSLDKVAKELNL